MSLDNSIQNEPVRLFTPIEVVAREVGQERAEVVRKFRDLVDSQKYKEAREYLASLNGEKEDLKTYSHLHLRILSFSKL